MVWSAFATFPIEAPQVTSGVATSAARSILNSNFTFGHLV
jgi:hypothetical protein